jgi:hypothetical protein
MIRRLLDAVSGVSFHRGLALGAMVGAAIAGSTVWTRLSKRRRASREVTMPAVAPGSERGFRGYED